MEWPVNMNLELAILLAAALLLVVAAVLAFVLVRRKNRSQNESSSLEVTFAAYRDSHPSFYRILSSLRGGDELNQLLERGDVRAAFGLLETRRPAQGQQASRRGNQRGMLDLGTTDDSSVDRTVQAAMLTIIRAVYLDDNLRRSLPEGAHSELDRLLESLTG